MKRIHAVVEGRVQGVFFRDFVRAHARRLQLTGWVRNAAAGEVEVVAEGEDAALDQLAMLLEQGPPPARVDDVRISDAPLTGEFTDFVIRY